MLSEVIGNEKCYFQTQQVLLVFYRFPPNFAENRRVPFLTRLSLPTSYKEQRESRCSSQYSTQKSPELRSLEFMRYTFLFSTSLWAVVLNVLQLRSKNLLFSTFQNHSCHFPGALTVKPSEAHQAPTNNLIQASICCLVQRPISYVLRLLVFIIPLHFWYQSMF